MRREEQVAKFRSEADEIYPHLSAAQRDAMAEHLANTHPGFDNAKSSESFSEPLVVRHPEFDELQRHTGLLKIIIVLLVILIILSLASRVHAQQVVSSGQTVISPVGAFNSGTLTPSAAGGTDIGSATLPFGNLWLGTAATNNFKFAPSTTTGARTVALADPGANVTLPFLSATDTTTTHAAFATATGGVLGTRAMVVGDLPATVVTSVASLTSNAVVIGGGGQASSTITADTTTTHALFATASAPAFRALATSDLPAPVDQSVQFCGTTSSCGHTIENNPKIVFGSAPLVSGTPSTVTISGISPAFTAAADYVCTVSDATTATNNLLKVANVSSSSFTITGPASITDTINYVCVGF